MRSSSRRRQRGAVILTVALMMIFLLGFVGIAVDLGRAFVVQGELQTAMDSCALAAAQELDGAADAITRAKYSGVTAGNVNRVQMQSDDWGGKGQLLDTEVTFLDEDYAATTSATDARYAACAHVQSDLQTWLLGALRAVSGSSTYPSTLDIGARAVATRGVARTACPLPLAIKPKSWSDTAANDFGFTVGEWVTLLTGPGEATNGNIGWANLDGSNSASETADELNGHCGTAIGAQLGTPGAQVSVVDIWNTRFGIYKDKNPDYTQLTERPDYTGYAYTPANWPDAFNAYDGTPSAGPASSFKQQRLAFASCGDSSTDVADCESITGLTLNSFKSLAAPGQVAGGHRQYGMNRRLVLVPVVTEAMKVQDFACMLMLQPLSIPLAPSVQLEYRGLASLPSTPCSTSGLPGAGGAGALVPTLVE
jgi:Flp pilus assembly protein TadG